MYFLCRETELDKLNRRYQQNQWECVIIYGRRRVGKTALINKFTEDKKTIYFSAINSTLAENVELFSKVIYEYKTGETDNAPIYQNIDSVFDEITKLGLEERIVVVIDEYPYLAKVDEGISAKLQHLIDHKWQNSKIYLILCGSSMSFMENQVLGYESPLYGRRTAQLKIESLTYRDTAKFVEHMSYEEKAEVYGITGGVPHYINKLATGRELKESIIENVFDTSAYLYEEPGNLLKQELREPSLYNSIISAIASGSTKLNEISTKTRLETSLCSKYLKTLMELGIIKKETPFEEETAKKTIYLIEDNLFRFWYKYVPQNYTSIVSNRIEKIYDRAIGERMHDYMGLIFEKMCKDYILYYDENLPFDLLDIGQWWGTDKVEKKEIQIDIVASPVQGNEKKNEYIVGSCKFKNSMVGVDELLLLKQYASVFRNGAKFYYYIFSLGGFSEELYHLAEREDIRLITLSDMYN